jgi:hypothetical protein
MAETSATTKVVLDHDSSLTHRAQPDRVQPRLCSTASQRKFNKSLRADPAETRGVFDRAVRKHLMYYPILYLVNWRARIVAPFVTRAVELPSVVRLVPSVISMQSAWAGRQSLISISTGTWSDGCGWPRSSLSGAAATNRSAKVGEARAWSIRNPISRCQAPA